MEVRELEERVIEITERNKLTPGICEDCYYDMYHNYWGTSC